MFVHKIRKSYLCNLIFVVVCMVGAVKISSILDNKVPIKIISRTVYKTEPEYLDLQVLTENDNSVDQEYISNILTSSTSEPGAAPIDSKRTKKTSLTSDESTIKGQLNNKDCQIPNVITADMIPDEERITQVLHVSYNRVDESILDQVENWEGPISIAVVFPSELAVDSSEVLCTAHFLNNLRETSADLKTKLSVHFLIPNYRFKAKHCSQGISRESIQKANCTNVEKPEMPEAEKVKMMASYPVNQARNFARNMTKTKYILIADMDHLFSKNFEAKMLTLAKRQLTKNPKMALVYRIFEVSDSVDTFPSTKEQLQKLMKEKKAQEFHKFYGAHSIPKLDEWFKRKSHGENDTVIQFIRKYESYQWEPQFVSLSSIPYHDTSFFYSVRDNTVLRWEMCRAGYQFGIVDDVFMYHPGIKTRQQNRVIDRVRRLVLGKSKQALKKLTNRFNKEYPETLEACPKLNKI